MLLLTLLTMLAQADDIVLRGTLHLQVNANKNSMYDIPGKRQN